MLNPVRAFLRLFGFTIGSFFYILRILLGELVFGHSFDRILRLRQQWFGLIHKLLGVKVEMYGELPSEVGLLVCNHRSYYDPLVILSEMWATPVGKIEMANWPVIGQGARLSGVIFVDRKSVEGRKQARQKIIDSMKNGYYVINYPEGTTHVEPQTTRFNPGLFKDAAAGDMPVYPIAIEYQNEADAWVGNDTFIRHFLECFGKKNTYIKISYGLGLREADDEKLISKSKEWIDSELTELRAGWHMPTA